MAAADDLQNTLDAFELQADRLQMFTIGNTELQRDQARAVGKLFGLHAVDHDPQVCEHGNFRVKTTEHIVYVVTVRSRKVRFGKLLCLQDTVI